MRRSLHLRRLSGIRGRKKKENQGMLQWTFIATMQQQQSAMGTLLFNTSIRLGFAGIKAVPDLLNWQTEKDMNEEAFNSKISPLADRWGWADAEFLADARQQVGQEKRHAFAGRLVSSDCQAATKALLRAPSTNR